MQSYTALIGVYLTYITMSQKRGFGEVDPDYEDVTEQQQKRQKILEHNAKESTVHKIEHIIHKHFNVELQKKEGEIEIIDERLHQARSLLDRLRACIVANYYSRAGQISGQVKANPNQVPSIHPSVKKLLGKTLPASAPVLPSTGSEGSGDVDHSKHNGTTSQESTLISRVELPAKSVLPQATLPKKPQVLSRSQGHITQTHGQTLIRHKEKKRVVVGNVSKYIPLDKRDDNDQATHKWMVYVRGSREEPAIEGFVEKVWFFLHPSYRPNDLVEINQPPFHLTRRGWGEFPIRVQLHFVDSRNKRVDIIHHLKLDKTFTGIQTLGSETHVDIELERRTISNVVVPTSLNITPHIPNPTPSLPIHRTSTPTPGLQPSTHQPPPVSHVIPKRENSEGDVKQSDSQSVVSELESENSLGIIWSHDQDKSHDQTKPQQVEYFEPPRTTTTTAEHQGIMGNGDVLLSSGAFNDLQAIASVSTRSDPSGPTSNLPRPNLVRPHPHTTAPTPSHRSRTPSKLQISRSLTPQGWTRLQIKQEEADSQSNSSGYGTSKTPEIKEEPMDDSYPRPPSRMSVTRTPHKQDPGFRPVSASGTEVPTLSGSGWTHVQIKSEPVTPDRSTSSLSGRTDHRSMTSTPEKQESQTSIPSSPATPDRVIRFELGRNMSPGLKLNMADTKNMLDIQRQAAGGSGTRQSGLSADSTQSGNTPSRSTVAAHQSDHEFSAPLASGEKGLTGSIDFKTWKQAQGKGKQSMTLGVGVAQLSSTSQGRVDASITRAPTLKTMLTQDTMSLPISSVSQRPLEPVASTATVKASTQVQDNVYVQCVDGSGKVFLIPQQMLKSGGNLVSQSQKPQTQLKPVEPLKLQLMAKAQDSGLKTSPIVAKSQGGGTEGRARTTVVGSGSNKATLTYMMSPQGLAKTGVAVSIAETPLVTIATAAAQVTVAAATTTTTSMASKVETSVVMATGSGQLQQRAQKLVLIPNMSSPHQVPLVASKNKVLLPGKSVTKPTQPTRQVIVKDQAGNTQIIQTSTALTRPSSVPAQQGKAMVKTIGGKPQVLPAGFVTVRSPLIQGDGSTTKVIVPSPNVGQRLSLQKSPVKSIIIPKDAGPRQILQLRGPAVPGKKVEGVVKGIRTHGPTVVQGSDKGSLKAVTMATTRPSMSGGVQLMVLAGNSPQQSCVSPGQSPVSSAGPIKVVAANGATSSVSKNAAQGTKAAAGMSLLRPGLILAKSLTSGSPVQSTKVAGNEQNNAADLPNRAAEIKMNSSVVATAVCKQSNDSPVLTARDESQDVGSKSKPVIGQSIVKSTSADLTSLLEQKSTKLDDGTKKSTSEAQPLFLTTKIGKQTVLLKIEQPPTSDISSNLPGSLKTALSTLSNTEKTAVTTKSSLEAEDFAKLPIGKSLDKCVVRVPSSGTIKHGSILGIGRNKEEPRLQEEEAEINVNAFPSMETLLSYLVRKYPLVCENVDRSLRPYCARSQDEYLGWNLGKRRASEWMRARKVRKRLISALRDSENLAGCQVWSTKQILVWCRQHCYTPLDQEITAGLSLTLSPSCRGQHRSYSTHTDHQGALRELSLLATTPGGSTEQEDAELDVVGFSPPTRAIKTEEDEVSMETEPPPSDILPPSPLTEFVSGVAQQVGVNFRPVTAAEVNGSSVMASLTEETLLSAARVFMGDILRQSVASQFKNKCFPQELSVDDIYRTLLRSPRWDFLTNANLGTQPHSVTASPVRTRDTH